MRFQKAKSICQLPATACTAMLLLVATAAPVKEGAVGNMDQLASDLASERYAVREKASDLLWKMGTSALPTLRQLTKSRDPEQAIRARELVRKIELGVYPDSDPELLAIIERYPKALPSEKKNLLDELNSRQAWRQMLKLYQDETNEMILTEHLRMMERIAVIAAREKLKNGDKREALELLKLGPATPSGLFAVAEFHRFQGTLKQELEKLKGIETKEAAAWRTALYRADGNFSAALENVDAEKYPQLAASLSLFTGDPIPWLQLRSQLPEKEASRGLSQLSRSLYARLATDRWNGNPMDPSELAELKKMVDNRSSQYRRVARGALFMLGDHAAGEASLLKDASMMGVHYLLMLERIDEAMEVLGVEGDQPCSEKWVRNLLKGMDEDAFEDFDDSEDSESLFIMAGFLESRGLNELAFECFRDPVLEFAEREKNAFLGFMMQLFNNRNGALQAPKLAIRLCQAWAGEDDEKWDQLTESFWAGDDDSHEWWKMLEMVDPEASRAERLEMVLVLLRRLPGEDGDRRKWLDKVWERFENVEEEEQSEALARLVDLAFDPRAGDIVLAEKIWPFMSEEMQNGYLWRLHISHLSARGNWKEVSKVLLKQTRLMEEAEGGSIDPASHAYVAAAYRRAGNIKEAEKHDSIAELLYLGDSGMADRISKAYGFGEDFERSRLWSQRAAQSAPPNGGRNFSKVLSAYAEAILFDSSQWALVAALNEVACCEGIDNSYYEPDVPLTTMRYRLKADTCRALSRIDVDKRGSVELLDQSHRNFVTDGVLADFFFPIVRMSGLAEEHDMWFGRSWDRFSEVMDRYPKCANTKNTAAWFASRAQRQLDAAEAQLKLALKEYPEQHAYLDTMAEIQFAKGKRKDALKWSRKAILMAPTDSELRRQYHHFLNDPLPK